MAALASRRPLALLALALVLLAALPCTSLASETSCCAAIAAPCGDAGESPCAQLAAAPCCGATQTPADATHAPQLPGASAAPFVACFVAAAPARAIGEGPRTRPPALTDHLAIRKVLLRL